MLFANYCHKEVVKKIVLHAYDAYVMILMDMIHDYAFSKH